MAQPLTIERVFVAPVEKVWAAWTDPNETKKWWGPAGFTAPSISIDFRVGGKYLFCMHGRPGPDMPAKDFWSAGTYKEIVPLKKIVCTDQFADADGHTVPASYYGMSKDFPMTMTVTFTFTAMGDQTKMTLTHESMPDSDDTGAKVGWNGSFDKLAANLK